MTYVHPSEALLSKRRPGERRQLLALAGLTRSLRQIHHELCHTLGRVERGCEPLDSFVADAHRFERTAVMAVSAFARWMAA